MYAMSDDEFEAVVQEAIDTLPERFLGALDNVGIAMQDEPDEDQLSYQGTWISAAEGDDDEEDGEELLGLYDGIALTERGEDYGTFGGDVPDVITIFKGPHERCFDSREQVIEEIRKTVIHEIGHYFGLDEEQLHKMGY